MKLFKKWSLARHASRNKNPILVPSLDLEEAGSDQQQQDQPDLSKDHQDQEQSGASGYGRVNANINSLPSNSRFADDQKCKHADKSGNPSRVLMLDAASGHQQSRIDNSDHSLIAVQLVDKVGSGDASSVEKAHLIEYGVKSIITTPLLESNNNVTSISINDDLDPLDLDDYVVVNVADIPEGLTKRSFLDFLIHLGHRIEYGITQEQLEAYRTVKIEKPDPIKKIPKVTRKRKRSAEELDAFARSLMGPLFKSPKSPKAFPSDRSSDSDDQSGDENLSTTTEESEMNVRDRFGLDDAGNITIGIEHIEEQRGEGMYVKKPRKYYKQLDFAKEIRENTRFRLPWKQLLKKLLNCLLCRSHGHPRNKAVFSGPGESIGAYALSLADDTESTFSRNISNFISCTKESKAAPQVVMRNMRQFMSGMKNYLVKHGEGEFSNEVQKARSQLKPDEFLNLDSILEEVMHRLVILPLREHLYGLFVDYYTHSGDIQILVEKVRQACGRGPIVFGIKNTVTPPNSGALRQISSLFVRLQEAELPLEKLDLLLTAVTTIFEGTACNNGQQLSADDFLPVLVLVVAHCGFIGAEIEAEYMWGLIQPSLLSGEAGYYLTALCSAVHVLKNFSLHEAEGAVGGSLELATQTLPECSSVLRVIIPDEYNGSIQTRTLPIRPHTTTKEVCRIIAHKARVTNAQDYGLFKLIDGEETLLQDNECPQDVRMAAAGKHCMIAYKRMDAKIAWPTMMPNSLTMSSSSCSSATDNNNH